MHRCLLCIDKCIKHQTSIATRRFRYDISCMTIGTKIYLEYSEITLFTMGYLSDSSVALLSNKWEKNFRINLHTFPIIEILYKVV